MKGTNMTIQTAKDFNTKLKGLVKSATSQRDNLQALIVFGFNHLEQFDDTIYLDKVIQAIEPIRVFRTQTAVSYIKDACTNLKYGKAKDGKPAFVKKEKGKDITITIPDYPWYNHDNDGQAKPDVDLYSLLKGLQTRLTNAMKDGKLKEGQEGDAKSLLEQLQQFGQDDKAAAKI